MSEECIEKTQEDSNIDSDSDEPIYETGRSKNQK